MAANRFDGECAACQRPVMAGAGVLTGRRGSWQTWCAQCRPTPPPRGRHSGWHREPIAALDFETTGIDPQVDRIVSYALLDEPGFELTGLVNPGIEIPDQASAVHGIDTAQVQDAPDPAQMVGRISGWVQSLIDRGVPLVVFNAAYDLSLLRAECRRHDVAEPQWPRLAVIDPFVIEWGIGLGRSGRLRLVDVAEFYGVDIAHAHDAACDAAVARRVAWEQAARHLRVGAVSVVELMQQQRTWFAERAQDWNAWASRHDRALDDPAGWPLSQAADRPMTRVAM